MALNNNNQQIVLPLGLTFELWVEFLINTFPNENIPLPPDVKHWWDWASLLILNPNFSIAPIPDKKVFPEQTSWELWAIYFIQNYQGT